MSKKKMTNPADEHPLLHPDPEPAGAQEALTSTLPAEDPVPMTTELDAAGAIIRTYPTPAPVVAEGPDQS